MALGQARAHTGCLAPPAVCRGGFSRAPEQGLWPPWGRDMWWGWQSQWRALDPHGSSQSACVCSSCESIAALFPRG